MKSFLLYDNNNRKKRATTEQQQQTMLKREREFIRRRDKPNQTKKLPREVNKGWLDIYREKHKIDSKGKNYPRRLC